MHNWKLKQALFLFLFLFLFYSRKKKCLIKDYNFNYMHTTVCKKVSQRIGLLKRIMNYLPLKQRLLYYNALIRPVSNYASVVWTNCDKEKHWAGPEAPKTSS